jgi:hypothetical protein
MMKFLLKSNNIRGKCGYEVELSVATCYGYSCLWTLSFDFFMNTETEIHIEKFSTDT